MFEDLLEKLKKCDQVQYEAGQHFIRILPTSPAGFSLAMEWIWDTHFTVFLDGWHQDFDSYEEALSCFTRAAAGHYRLKARSKGSSPFRWTVEYWDGSCWVEHSTTTNLIYPFWKPTTTRYLRNHLHCGATPDASPSAWSLAAAS